MGRFPGIRVFVQNPPVINIGGRQSKSLYQYTLQGSDIDQLYASAQALEARLRDLPELRDVTTDLQIRNPQIRVAIDRERASRIRGHPRPRSRARSTTPTARRQASTIYTANNQYAVVIELLPQYQRDLSALRLLSIRGTNGTLVPLTALATVTEDLGPLTVNHSGPAARGDPLASTRRPGSRSAQAVAAVQRLAGRRSPAGRHRELRRHGPGLPGRPSSGLLMLLVLAILVIYIVLGILYESFVHPLTILSGLPFAGFGALLALCGWPVWTSASTPSWASSCWSAWSRRTRS